MAHRGASGHLPEHTIDAYQLAVDMGAEYIEQDLQLTKDNVLICMHDSTVNRTTNGTGAVSDMTLAQIKSLDIAGGRKVPTFEEVVVAFINQNIKFYTETKRPHDTKMDDELLRVLQKYDLIGFEAWGDRVIVQSFSEESLKYIYQRYSDIPLVKLTSSPASENLDEIKKYGVGVGPRFANTTSAFVKNAQNKGLVVHPYTINSESDMITAIGWGVDGMFTNYPDIALNLRGDD